MGHFSGLEWLPMCLKKLHLATPLVCMGSDFKVKHRSEFKVKHLSGTFSMDRCVSGGILLFGCRLPV